MKKLEQPKRIQRKRTKGWRMPENTVYVGRGSRWGNPYQIGVDGTAEECVQKYIKYHLPYTHRGEPVHETKTHDLYISEANINDIKISLGGKNLACWCNENETCHADFLLEAANKT